MAEAVRGGDPAALLELTLDDPSPSVAQLQVSVYPAVDAPEACDLRAQLRLPGAIGPILRASRLLCRRLVAARPRPTPGARL